MVSTPKPSLVLLIIIPFLNGYFIRGIPHFQTYPYSEDPLEGMDF